MSKPNPNPDEGKTYDAQTHQWVQDEVKPADETQTETANVDDAVAREE